MTLRLGQTIAGKYRVEQLRGVGGMAEVYLATNTVLRKSVALKVLKEEIARSPEASERFLREGVAASQASHRAIVEVYDAGVHDGVPWMAMELLQGESLHERLKRGGPMKAATAVAIAVEVLGGLAAVHEKGIVHRDLKPPNIFLEQQLDGTMQPKILDFGIAKIIPRGFGDALNGGTSVTEIGVVMGTVHYLSPEQIRGLPDIDARADIYAMGTVLYEMLSGDLPYDASSLMDLVAKVLTEPPRNLAELRPDLPAELVTVVHRCLRANREERPQEATTLATMLDASVGQHTDPLRRLKLVSGPPPSAAHANMGDSTALDALVAEPADRAGAGGAGGVRVARADAGSTQRSNAAPPAGLSADRIGGSTPWVSGPMVLPEVTPRASAPIATLASAAARPVRLWRNPFAWLSTALAAIAIALSVAALRENLGIGTADVGLTWVPIAAGRFQMGCSPDDTNCQADESPPHAVTVQSFEMTSTEITQAQYKAVLGNNPSRQVRCPTCPVDSVTWQQARRFCLEAGGRLPSEAEWEYAARQGAATRFSCGHPAACVEGIAWYVTNSENRTRPVGTKTAGAFGLYDMLGNVWEWNEDCYHSTYEHAPSTGDVWQGGSCGLRVVRGGSFDHGNPFLRVSARLSWSPDAVMPSFGFRCVRDP